MRSIFNYCISFSVSAPVETTSGLYSYDSDFDDDDDDERSGSQLTSAHEDFEEENQNYMYIAVADVDPHYVSYIGRQFQYLDIRDPDKNMWLINAVVGLRGELYFENSTAAVVSSTDAYEPEYTPCDELIASEWACFKT